MLPGFGHRYEALVASKQGREISHVCDIGGADHGFGEQLPGLGDGVCRHWRIVTEIFRDLREKGGDVFFERPIAACFVIVSGLGEIEQQALEAVV